jgi:hypothetical protein
MSHRSNIYIEIDSVDTKNLDMCVAKDFVQIPCKIIVPVAPDTARQAQNMLQSSQVVKLCFVQKGRRPSILGPQCPCCEENPNGMGFGSMDSTNT